MSLELAIVSLLDFTTPQNLPIHACKRLSYRFRCLKWQISCFGYTRVGLSDSGASVFQPPLGRTVRCQSFTGCELAARLGPIPLLVKLFRTIWQIDFLKLSEEEEAEWLFLTPLGAITIA